MIYRLPMDHRLKGILAAAGLVGIVTSVTLVFTDIPKAEIDTAAPRLISECEKEVVDAILAPAANDIGKHAMAVQIRQCDKLGLVTPEEKEFFLSSSLGDELRKEGY
ncbi:hypothetical protein [Phyllobacterium salinisoli]|nr:hypothetical protein [Phyllobacterium salinisoli]